MLLYHQVDSFLCVVKVELVVVSLLAFLLLFLAVIFIVIATTSPVSILEQNWGALSRLRLGEAIIFRTTKDLLL